MAAYPFLFENRRRLQHRHDMPPASGHHQLSAITLATKAATQVLAHLAKVGFYGLTLITATGGTGVPPWWVLGLAFGLGIIGTAIGAAILGRISDKHFLHWTKWIITAMGVAYGLRALHLFGGL